MHSAMKNWKKLELQIWESKGLQLLSLGQSGHARKQVIPIQYCVVKLSYLLREKDVVIS